jgi:hypothetical protein
MKHYNLHEKTEFLDLFLSTISKIYKGNEPLSRNYSPDNFKLEEFPYISIIVEDDRIIALSGLQIGRWGEKIGRISSRLWVDNSKRSKTSIPIEYASTIMIPEQIKFAQDNDFDLVFWSSHRPSPRVFHLMVERANNRKYGYKHIPLPYLYNVCLNSNNDSCWQHVAVVKLKDDAELNLPYKNN